MKQNRFTKLLAAGVAGAFALGTAFGQDSSTTTTTTAGGTTGISTTTTDTSALDGTGTITTFSPDGNMMTVRTSTSTQPALFYYTPQTVVVDPTGATVQLSALRPDMPVSYTYTKEGDRMVVTKVTLQKPITYYEKKETTTTTTTSP
jgi:hypothetical protein